MARRQAPADLSVIPQARSVERQNICRGVFPKTRQRQAAPNIVNMWDVIEERCSKYDPDNQYARELHLGATTGLGVNSAS